MNVDANGKSYNKTMLIILLLVGTFCTILNQTILSTAFPTLMKAFDINTSTVQWLTSGFMMVNGIAIPVSAWLSSRVNTKWLYLGAMIVFEIGTIVSFFASNFGILLAGRLIQAAGVGVTMPLLQTIMLSIFPPEKRGAAMGLSGVVIGLAPAIGPTLSGWILINFTWRDLFGMIIPIVALVILLGFKFMRPILPTKKSKIDVLSLILSTIGFGSALYGFSEVGTAGWGSTTVISTLIVGAIFIALFVWRQLVMTNPFLNIRVFKNVRFTVATAMSSITMMALVGFEMVLPLYLQIIRGMNAFHSGLTLLLGALMMGIVSPFAGQIFDKYGAKKLVTTGFLLLIIGTIPFTFLTEDASVTYIVLLYAVRTFGMAMVMMPATTYGMNALSTDMINHGTAVNNTVRQVGSAIATAVLVSILSNVTTSNMPSTHLKTLDPVAYGHSALSATLSGYHAAFWVAAIFTILGLIVSFAVSDKKGGNK
ncbi:multidrug efflux MFS transporter [Apilactobacillus apisilvae]|uniref:Multidrug efflux MFS transporter n=1 Tax=Apilactobacillus apisilvae TaxID=2923364 RepID=A0ABY4PHJ1_9LACO|nr:MDR family MFS transporter [Apilactobacillus apisilvae]UQS84973.1 multidrug efflux MFS transporter [Apilactobacillus apisilvae]